MIKIKLVKEALTFEYKFNFGLTGFKCKFFAKPFPVQQYVRKYVITHAIESPGFPKPLYDGITEIWFDSFDDYHQFFATENYLKNAHPDEGNFII